MAKFHGEISIGS
jgi:hypothetical protein